MSKEDRDDILAARASDAMARVASVAKGKDMSEWEDESGSRASQTTLANFPVMQIKCLGTVSFTYTNWRGETRSRRAVFENIFFGKTEWHSEPQWLVEAMDLDICQRRHFALRDMKDVTYEP